MARAHRPCLGGCLGSSRLFALPSLFLGLLSHEAMANGENGIYFMYPAGGETFFFSDVVNVTYTSPFSSPTLWTFCDASPNPKYIKRQAAPANNGWALVPMNFTGPGDCWFDLRPTEDQGHGANSEAFHFSSASRALTTMDLSSPATSTVTLTGVQGGGTAGAASSGNSLNTGAIAGICVGFAALAILLGGLTVAYWYRRRKHSDRRPQGFHNGPMADHAASGSGRGMTQADAFQPGNGHPPPAGYGYGYDGRSEPAPPAGFHGHDRPSSIMNTPAAYYQHHSSAQGGNNNNNNNPPPSYGYGGQQPTTAGRNSQQSVYEMPAPGAGAGQQQPGSVASHATGSTSQSSSSSTAPLASTSTSAPAAAAELPSRHDFLGSGHEHEMAATPPPPPPRAVLPYSMSGSEQKFLTQDLRPPMQQQHGACYRRGGHGQSAAG